MQQLNPTAVVSGSGFTTTYVDQYVIHEFKQSTSFVVESPIIANIHLVGGGGGGREDGMPGAGGKYRSSLNQTLTTGTYDVFVGDGGYINTLGGSTSLQYGPLNARTVLSTGLSGWYSNPPANTPKFRMLVTGEVVFYCPN
jgi:hypothetical protein